MFEQVVKKVTKKVTVVAIVAAGVFATSAVPASAMSLNGSVKGECISFFGTSQKREIDPYVLVYWTGCSYSTAFSMGLYTNEPTDPNYFKLRNTISYKSKASISLSSSAYSVTLGVVPVLDKSKGTVQITGTWEVARGDRKAPANLEEAE